MFVEPMYLYSQKSAPRAYRSVMHLPDMSNFVHDGAVVRVRLHISLCSRTFDGRDSMEKHVQLMSELSWVT